MVVAKTLGINEVPDSRRNRFSDAIQNSFPLAACCGRGM